MPREYRSSLNAKTFRCLEVAMDIPLVRSAKDNADSLYVSVRSVNMLSRCGFFVAETGFGIFVRAITPITGKLQTPLVVVDKMACMVLEGVKQQFPVLSENTDRVIESGRVSIFGSGLGKKTLTGVDTMLGIVEAVLTMVPMLSAEENNDSVLVKALMPIRLCYGAATYPVKLTVTFIQSSRSRIESLSARRLPAAISDTNGRNFEGYAEPKVTIYERLMMLNTCIAYNVFFFPRIFLQIVGRATCDFNEKMTRRMIPMNMHDESDDDWSSDDHRNRRKYSLSSYDPLEILEDDQVNQVDSETSSVVEAEIHAENTENTENDENDENAEAFEEQASANDSQEFCSSETTICEEDEVEHQQLESDDRRATSSNDNATSEGSSQAHQASICSSPSSQYESSPEDTETEAQDDYYNTDGRDESFVEI